MPHQPRRRAGAAVQWQMQQLGLTVDELAQKAKVDPTTIRRFTRGDTWPREATRAALEAALNWPAGKLIALATVDIHTASCAELRTEMDERCGASGT